MRGLTLALVLAWMTTAAPAHAADFVIQCPDRESCTPMDVTYVGGAGEVNDVHLTFDPVAKTLLLMDGAVPMNGPRQTPSIGSIPDELICTGLIEPRPPHCWGYGHEDPPSHSVECTRAPGVTRCTGVTSLGNVLVDLSDGDDSYASDIGSAERLEVIGGLGNDTINADESGFVAALLDGELGNDVIIGRAGADRLHGGAGDDLLFGGAGGDALTGDLGSDTLSGGDGRDLADYGDSLTSEGVTVTFDGQANDGMPLENDAIGDDVEGVVGTPFVDRLVGDDRANDLYGGQGADRVEGRGGRDLVDGGEGGDFVWGGLGVDTVFGRGGNDTIRVTDGAADTFSCGGGVDQFEADAIDSGDRAACEFVYGALLP